MKTQYTLEVLRGKSYRKMYTGKQSQCFKRLGSIRDRCRIKRDGAEVIFQREQVSNA